MRVLVFVNSLGTGGTEKAACRWAKGLKERGHEVSVLSLIDGPRRAEVAAQGMEARVVATAAQPVADEVARLRPDVIHAHSPGHPHIGDVLGDGLALLPKIPVVQTNIFAHLRNEREAAWTDFRLFVSWTGAVQAARRSFRPLNLDFFQRCSVAVNPIDPDPGPAVEAVKRFRASLGIRDDEVVFGHLGRPDAIRWDQTPIRAFRRAWEAKRNLRFLLRTPPPEVTAAVRNGPQAEAFLVLPVTADAEELRLTSAAMDAVLHYSRVGESFGYGIAEPMNLGKPVIVNTTPWDGQAQVELARHGEAGFVVGTQQQMTHAILRLASEPALRQTMGNAARRHIQSLASPETSLDRLEQALAATVQGKPNPLADEDLQRAQAAAAYLDRHQFGHTWQEQLALRVRYYRVRFHQWRHARRRPPL